MRLRHSLLPALTSIAVIAALASPAAAAVHGSGRDSDRDGMPDRWEVAHRLNPKKAADGTKDGDKDGLTNRQEYRLGGDPRSDDTDRDGVDDGLEVKLKTRLNAADSDGDGVKDGDDDANHDGICDRDQRAAFGTIVSFDEATGDLVLTTRSGTSRTVTLTDDTEIEQRERRGWAHRPGGELSSGPRSDDSDDPDSMDPSADDDWVEGDAGDMPSDDADSDSDDTASDDSDFDSGDVVDPVNAELLSTGTVVLKVKVDDDLVTELRLA